MIFPIVERAQAYFIGSKGKGLQPRRLEVMDDFGIINRVCETDFGKRSFRTLKAGLQQRTVIVGFDRSVQFARRTMMDVLVIGRNAEVLETVKEGLTAIGITADGTTAAERACIDFDARDFAVVAFGGGVGRPLRETLKSEFKRQNPGVILLDTFAPLAVPHITSALRGDLGKRRFASRFEITEDDGSYLMHLDLKKECDVCVEAYQAKNGFHSTTLGRGRLPAGPFVFRIHEQEIYDGLNIILVTLGGTEFYLHRIER